MIKGSISTTNHEERASLLSLALPSILFQRVLAETEEDRKILFWEQQIFEKKVQERNFVVAPWDNQCRQLYVTLLHDFR